MVDLLRLALGPVLLWQGRRLYRTIPKLPEPPGDRSGTRGTGPSLRLLIIGDSSGAGVGARTQEEALTGQTVSRLAGHYSVAYRLEARTGSTVPRTIRHLQKQEPEPYDVALFAIGLNDLLAGQGLTAWMESFVELAETVRDKFGVSRIVVSGLPPIGRFPALPQPLRWVVGRTAQRHDQALEAWVDATPDADYFDFRVQPGDPLYDVPMEEIMASDGFHPGPRIYEEWGRRATEAILSAMPANHNVEASDETHLHAA
ncbi:MAG: SGNH/GDSL hydrolase family protein [Bacteroidota bacterium]